MAGQRLECGGAARRLMGGTGGRFRSGGSVGGSGVARWRCAGGDVVGDDGDGSPRLGRATGRSALGARRTWGGGGGRARRSAGAPLRRCHRCRPPFAVAPGGGSGRARCGLHPSEAGKARPGRRPGRVLECTLSGMALGFLQYLWDPATLPSPTRLRAELQTNRPRHRPHPRPGCHPNPAHLIHPWLVIQVLAIG